MAIKISYIFLRTLAIAKDIELYAADGFFFNENRPIKALKNLAFVKKENEKIVTEFLKIEKNPEFNLPEKFQIENFSKDIEPLYILPAV